MSQEVIKIVSKERPPYQNLLLTLGLSAVLVAASSFALAGGTLGETIQLGVSHSEYLPAVTDLQSKVELPVHYQSISLKASTPHVDLSAERRAARLRADASTSASNIALTPAVPVAVAAPVVAPKAPTLAQPMIEWFTIPPTMAGIWNKRGDTTTSVTDLRTGVCQPLNQWTDDDMTVTWGHQIDKQGNYWHANLLPAERDGRSNGKFVKFLTVKQLLEGTAADALRTRTHYIISESARRNGAVIDIFQQEALNNYRILTSDQLENQSTNRVFAYNGQAVRDGVLLSNFTRVGGFSPTSSLSGIDLVKSLNEYLQSIGHAELAP